MAGRKRLGAQGLSAAQRERGKSGAQTSERAPKRSSKSERGPARRLPTPRGVPQVQDKLLQGATLSELGKVLGLDPLRYVKRLVREVPDFPSPGILFRDLTPVLADPKAFAFVLDLLSSRFVAEPIDVVVGVEARGFIFGAALAARLNKAFVPVRKPGKLPARTERVAYELEYGHAELEIHADGLTPGQRVLVVDDLLATGGTASAAGELVRGRGALVLAYVFVIELLGLNGRKALEPTPVLSLIQYG
ncbi:MAG TPA: adenine phosphoribosyltransferase [Polyangiaceae bacterium]|nr:adenine phosphoribosyltransferase [Polyangiaceae bacterium]